MFKDGFDDAVSGYWFRWRSHPRLNDYRLGYKKGELTLINNPSSEVVVNGFEKLNWTITAISSISLYMLVFYFAITNGWF